MTAETNRKATRSLLKAILAHKKDVLDYCFANLKVDDLFGKEREVYQIMREMYSKDEPIDLITVADKGVDPLYVARLADEDICASVRQAEKRVEIIKKHMFLNRVGNVSKSLASIDTMDDVASIQAQVMRELETLNKDTERKASHISEVINSGGRQIDREIQGLDPRLMTGITKIDQTKGMFGKAQSIIMAARPGVGKTAFACNIAYSISQKLDVLFPSHDHIDVGRNSFHPSCQTKLHYSLIQ